jgi:hypothetical protein
MTISLDETVKEVKRYFRDVKWATSTIESWVYDAVRDYSHHFPLVKEVSGSATSGTYEYSLAYLVLGLIEFEYPTGEDPPEYPEQCNHRESHFFEDGISYYDLVSYAGKNAAEIWLSDPETGESYNIKFLTEHEWTANGSDYEADIPDSDRHIIVQYVIWQCWREMLTIESENADSDRRAYISEQIADAARSYSIYLSSLKRERTAESEFIKWEMDRFDNIY